MSLAPAPAKIGLILWDQGGRLAEALDLAGLAGQLARVKAVAKVEAWSGPLAEAAQAAAAALQAGQADRLLWLGRFSPEQRAGLTAELGRAGLNSYLLDFLDPAAAGVLGMGLAPAFRLRKALVLAKVAAARLRLSQPLEPTRLAAVDRAVVIGAGAAGLHAAATLARLGHAVTLVERRSGLGGKTALLSRFYPLGCDPACGLHHVLGEIAATGRVEVRTLTEVVSLAGRPGAFEVSLRRAPRYVAESRCTACGACAAVCPVELPAERPAVQDEEPLWPTSTGLLALSGRRVKAVHPAEPLAHPAAWVVERESCPPGCRLCQEACPHQAVDLDMAPAEERVQAGMVLVATGWDPYPLSNLHDYGYGRLKRVIGNLELERLLADAPAFDWAGVKGVGFIQCAGSREAGHLAYCSAVCCSATLKQIKRLRELNPAARCYVFYQDLRCPGFDEDLLKEVDALPDVLFIRGNPAEVDGPDPDGPVTVLAEDTGLGRKVRLTLDLVVLAGGLAPARGTERLAQVLGLPLNRHGFFEAHLQCHPEESQRTGVYVGGSARQPMGVAAAIDSAHRALAEGLRFLGGEIEVPPTHPLVDPGKCDKCKRCVEDCPFQAYGLDEAGFPRPDLADRKSVV
jgi:heterodisulfide reductase subunit A/quinone-modifying oxidoreductase subunit QmoB